MYKGKRESGRADWRGWLPCLWFPAVLIYQELVVRFWTVGAEGEFWHVLLFAGALGAICNIFCCLWGKKGNQAAAGLLTVLSTVWLGVQTVYYTIFRMFLTVYSLGGAGQVMEFWREALSGMAEAWLPLLLLLLPGVFYFACGHRFVPECRLDRRGLTGVICGAAVLQAAAVVGVNLDTGGVLSARYLYYEEFVPELSVSHFGVLTTLRLDMAQLLGIDWGAKQPEKEQAEPLPEEPVEPETLPEQETVPEAEPVVYQPNVMELDFASLEAEGADKAVQALSEWFAQREPTMQNEYTGYFAGKNLIWFTAEGFSRFAVDPELTPTLYKLANSGFVFENFYNPLWWASTTDGEYVACTGLIPKPGVWSLYQSRNNSLYFCMGNQLQALGYDTRAYHNHSYTYYHREESHPNMGYDYKGKGNGLKVTSQWPESDLEMMELTLPEYVADTPFHAYYMTVSGHMNYNFPGNNMAGKHKDEVGHEEWSEAARAYLACQMELDLALEHTLNYLEETGHLEDTVICLSADHYPYGLEQAALEELNGGPVDMRFDVYRSTLILWSGDMEETVTVSKPCSSLDILPTLSNLFGLEYDSRLLMGRDILSDSPGLVVFSDRSFLTEKGRYDAKQDQFIPNEGAEVSERYAAGILSEVNQMFSGSKTILEKDYYGKMGLVHEITQTP